MSVDLREVPRVLIIIRGGEQEIYFDDEVRVCIVDLDSDPRSTIPEDFAHLEDI